MHPTIGEARAQALAGLVLYSDDKPKTSGTAPLGPELESYARHHDQLMASRPAPLVTGMP